jgi:SSS family solute:Na+ symporter
MLLLFAVKINWNEMMAVLQTAPPGHSLVVPGDSGRNGFNVWFFLINVFLAFYTTMAWQGSQGFQAAARSAHEARMAGILAEWRKVLVGTVMALIPVAIWAMLHAPAQFGWAAGGASVSASVMGQLHDINANAGAAVTTQMTVPVALGQLLPVGLLGAFAAMMLGAFLTTHNTYLHSWGSIFVQDVVLPIRRGFGYADPSPGVHIRLLRISIVGVAVFICLFSALFRHQEFIRMFQLLTGSVYMAGAGAVIIGGLYWRGGTTRAAWTALTTGAAFAGAGLAAQQLWPGYLFPHLHSHWPGALVAITRSLDGISNVLPGVNWRIEAQHFPIDSAWLSFFSMLASIAAYFIVSWLDRVLAEIRPFDLAQLYSSQAQSDASLCDSSMCDPSISASSTFRDRLAMILPSAEFTRGDKLIYWSQMAWSLGLFGIFVVGTVLGAMGRLSFNSWARFWHYKIGISIVLAIATGVWFCIGGLRDLAYMLRALRVAERDSSDNGQVHTKDGALADDAVDTATKRMDAITDACPCGRNHPDSPVAAPAATLLRTVD